MSAPGKPTKVAVIATSTRIPRVGDKITKLVKEIIERGDKDVAAGSYELGFVDLADFKLPVYDEAVIPAMVPETGSFSHEHTKRWSSEIASYDAYVIVVPEYNYSMAGGTKNAIDYLSNEWKGKPIVIVSYGISGGLKASEAAKSVLEGMKLKVTETRPTLEFAGGVGPDLQTAMGTGELGEETRKKIEGEAPTILKGFAELKGLLVMPA